MRRTERAVLKQFVISDSQRLIAGKKPHQRLKFRERPWGSRSPWVCQSTAASMLEQKLIERESPGVYVITMDARVAYIQDLTDRLRFRELALLSR